MDLNSSPRTPAPAPVAWLRRILRRPEGEQRHALQRLAIAGAALALALALPAEAPAMTTAVPLAGLYLGLALVYLLAMLMRPGPLPMRRWLGLVVDVACISQLIVAFGPTGMLLVGALLWISIGNGARFGRRHLLAATLLSTLGYIYASHTAGYWRDLPTAAAVLLLLLLTVPAYIGSLFGRLQRAVTRAEDANRLKSRFLAGMHQELRTPLNGVVSLSELLLETRLSAEQQALSRDIGDAARSVLQWVEPMLDSTRPVPPLQGGQITNFDLHRLVNDTTRLFAQSAQRRKLHIATHIAPETPFMLRGDARHLRQLLVSLIGNAVRQTGQGRVDISITPTAVEARQCRLSISVTDTRDLRPARPGADPATTGEATTDHGLGKVILQQLVDRLGGGLHTHRLPGRGAKAVVELPLEIQPATGNRSATQVLPGARVMLLLGPDSAEPVQTALRGWTVDGESLASSAQLLTRLLECSTQAQACTAVLIDQSRLDVDPTQFARALHAEPRLRDLSLVLLSRQPGLNVAACLQAGYSSVLRLPLDKTLLFNALHAASSQHELADNVVSLAQHYRSRRHANRLRVLLAEADPSHRKSLLGVLQQAGHEVVEVGRGDEALDSLSSEFGHFDALILSTDLPDRDGLAVLKALRFLEYDGQRMPVLMIGENDATAAEEICRDAGADLLLARPVEGRRLLDTLAQLTGRAESTAPARAVSEAAETRPATTLIVNESKLDSLARLGAGIEFVRELAAGFQRDGDRLMAELETAAAEQDYRRFRDALHAFRGSGIELGCQYLVAECQAAGQLKAFEIGSRRALDFIERINAAYMRTCEMLTEYVDARRDAR